MSSRQAQQYKFGFQEAFLGEAVNRGNIGADNWSFTLPRDSSAFWHTMVDTSWLHWLPSQELQSSVWGCRGSSEQLVWRKCQWCWFLSQVTAVVSTICNSCYLPPSSRIYRSLVNKGPMGGTHYFVLRQGGGWIFVTTLHFTTKKRPCLHYNNLQQDTVESG